MTSELSNFAARLREFIHSEGRAPRGPDFQIQNDIGDSCNSSLRDDGRLNPLALELFALQFAHNTAYRKICEARGVSPKTVKHWTRIPAVPTSAFKELDLTCLPPHQRATVFHSSGTTEQRPSRHFHNAESLAVYETSLWSWFRIHLLSDKLKLGLQPSATPVGVQASACGFPGEEHELAILTPPPIRVPHSSLVHMFDVVRRELGAPDSSFMGELTGDGSWAVNFQAAAAALRRACKRQSPLVLLGTAFSFVHLLDSLAEQNVHLQLPARSRVMETGGYKGRSRRLPKAELHALITQHLGVPPSHIVCEYGMSELSSQAYDGAIPSSGFRVPGSGSAFRFPCWARAQIISPETGHEVAERETGLICVFDLANVFSVMAVQTEDLAARRADGFDLIGRAEHVEPRGCSLMVA
jgi:hypothetical protein